jgi:hypothetical protein
MAPYIRILQFNLRTTVYVNSREEIWPSGWCRVQQLNGLTFRSVYVADFFLFPDKIKTAYRERQFFFIVAGIFHSLNFTISASFFWVGGGFC